MIFMILCGVLVLAIAFVHYIQGFFSSTISAILAILAAVLAFSWHETVAETVFKQNMAAYSHALSLLLLFSAIYITLRMIFDKAVPGGPRLPATADKAGAAIMGLVAAGFGVGIFAIAAQEMPLGPGVAGYARYGVQKDPRHAVITRNFRGIDSETYEEILSSDPGVFDEAQRNTIWIDDLVLGTTKYLSDSGSLQGSQKIGAVHPDFLQEMFSQRLGIQSGGPIRVMYQAPGSNAAVTVDSIYRLNSAKMEDYLPLGVRDKATHDKWEGTLSASGGSSTKGGPQIAKDQMMVVVRLVLNRIAADPSDRVVRFSPGSVRLVANHKDASGNIALMNYYPWGTVESGNMLYVNKLDDFLFLTMGDTDSKAVDLLYVIDKDGFVMPGAKGGNETIVDGTFLEFKRMARIELGGQSVTAAPKPLNGLAIGIVLAERVTPLVPYDPKATPAVKPTPAAPQTLAPVSTQPTQSAARGSFTSGQQNVASIGGRIFNYSSVAKASVLPFDIAVPSADLAKPAIAVDATAVEATVKNKKFSSLLVNPKVSVATLGTGDVKIRDLLVPDGQVMFLINSGQPSEPWAWAEKANTFELLCSDNKRVKPRGLWAVIQDGGEERLLVRYGAEYDLDAISPIPSSGKATQVTLAFLLPTGVVPKELTVDSQIVKELSQEPIR